MTDDPLFIQFIYYFNMERDYFECHEVMEELWLEEGRDLLCQGLLQVAVGLFHARNDNVSGAIKLFTQALDKLRRYADSRIGIDLPRLIQDSERYLARLEVNTEEPFPFEDMTIIVTDDALSKQVEAFASQAKG